MFCLKKEKSNTESEKEIYEKSICIIIYVTDVLYGCM